MVDYLICITFKLVITGLLWIYFFYVTFFIVLPPQLSQVLYYRAYHSCTLTWERGVKEASVGCECSWLGSSFFRARKGISKQPDLNSLLCMVSFLVEVVLLVLRARDPKEKPSQACEQPAQTNLILVIRTVTWTWCCVWDGFVLWSRAPKKETHYLPNFMISLG